MNFENGNPPKDKDFLIIGSNGKMITASWSLHPNGKWYINTQSDNAIHCDKIKWHPLPEIDNVYTN